MVHKAKEMVLSSCKHRDDVAYGFFFVDYPLIYYQIVAPEVFDR